MKKRGMGSKAYGKRKQKEVASLGGKALHERGLAHRWTSEEARAARLAQLSKREEPRP